MRCSDREMVDAVYVGECVAKDPHTGAPVTLEIYKDPSTGGMFAVDASYLDQVCGFVYSPFDKSVTLKLDGGA